MVPADGQQVAGPSSSPDAAASTCVMASAMSNGLQAMSPASATCCPASGDTPSAGCHGRSSREPWRTALGPNLAPGR